MLRGVCAAQQIEAAVPKWIWWRPAPWTSGQKTVLFRNVSLVTASQHFSELETTAAMRLTQGSPISVSVLERCTPDHGVLALFSAMSITSAVCGSANFLMPSAISPRSRAAMSTFLPISLTMLDDGKRVDAACIRLGRLPESRTSPQGGFIALSENEWDHERRSRPPGKSE